MEEYEWKDVTKNMLKIALIGSTSIPLSSLSHHLFLLSYSSRINWMKRFIDFRKSNLLSHLLSFPVTFIGVLYLSSPALFKYLHSSHGFILCSLPTPISLHLLYHLSSSSQPNHYNTEHGPEHPYQCPCELSDLGEQFNLFSLSNFAEWPLLTASLDTSMNLFGHWQRIYLIGASMNTCQIEYIAFIWDQWIALIHAKPALIKIKTAIRNVVTFSILQLRLMAICKGTV